MNLRESVDRILVSPNVFGGLFYERFLSRCPDAQSFFAGTDMQRQAIVLTTSLLVVQQHRAHHYPATTHYLKYLGTQHRDRKVPELLYAQWRDAMLDSLATFHDHEWTDDLARDWHAAFDEAIDLMLDGYTERCTI